MKGFADDDRADRDPIRACAGFAGFKKQLQRAKACEDLEPGCTAWQCRELEGFGGCLGFRYPMTEALGLCLHLPSQEGGCIQIQACMLLAVSGFLEGLARG